MKRPGAMLRTSAEPGKMEMFIRQKGLNINNCIWFNRSVKYAGGIKEGFIEEVTGALRLE